MFQGVLRASGKARELAQQQVHDVVRVSFGVNALQIPSKRPRAGIEVEQVLLVQGGQELNREERITMGLLEDELGKRPDPLRLVMKGVGDEFPDIALQKGSKDDVVMDPSGSSRSAARSC